MKRLQSREEMALKFRIGFLYIIPEGRQRCYHRSTGYQRFHTGAYECMEVCFCTATSCHQCYFLQLIKHLMILMWLFGIHIHVLQHIPGWIPGKVEEFQPSLPTAGRAPTDRAYFYFSHLSCKTQYQNYNTITVNLEFLEILLTFLTLHRKMLNM
jgi:hypothetical protein